MKAILLNRSDRAKIANALFAVRGSTYVERKVYDQANDAIRYLDFGSKDVNPFDVFEPFQKRLIVEALEYSAAAYRLDGDPGKVERSKQFEAIARQAKTGIEGS